MRKARLISHLCARPLASVAVLGLLAAALMLGGCGRKGPLDPPPSAAAPTPTAPSASRGILSPLGSSVPSRAQGVDHHAGVTRDGRAIAPKGPNKRIPLDVLLD